MLIDSMQNLRFTYWMRLRSVARPTTESIMSAAEFLPLILFVLVSTITPGGATALATASGAHYGYRRSLPLIAGIAVGLGSMAAFAAAGLGGVILAWPSLQFAMKFIGTCYLLWLAWKMSLSGPPHLNATVSKPTSFIGAAWLVWHNPKGWAMALGAAASFAAIATAPWSLGAVLGITFALGAVLSLSLWCLAGLLLARLIKTDAQWRVLNVMLGLLLAASILPMWFE
jgi:threonine/homoserine/homoserine lactone efflux protein